MNKFLSIGQAAELCSFSKRFLYALCHDGKIRYYRIQKRILLDPADLENFIRAGMVEAKGAHLLELKMDEENY